MSMTLNLTLRVKYGQIYTPREACVHVKKKSCDQQFATNYDFSAFAQDLDLDLHYVMLMYMKKANAGVFQSWDIKLKYDKINKSYLIYLMVNEEHFHTVTLTFVGLCPHHKNYRIVLCSNFIILCQIVLELLCWQTDRQTDIYGQILYNY